MTIPQQTNHQLSTGTIIEQFGCHWHMQKTSNDASLMEIAEFIKIIAADKPTLELGSIRIKGADNWITGVIEDNMLYIND